MAFRSSMACGCNFSSPSPNYGLREKRERELWFLKHGARLLHEQISNCEDKGKQLQFFSLKELSKATNNFDERRIAGSGDTDAPINKGSHEVRTLTIWRITNSSERAVDCVFSEIVMLSQINHMNVLRILGGCFETASPMPVLEFICNENMYHVIHEKDLSSQISWENRLRIATEVADALAYLHTGTSKPIVHRDIKSAKNLLDEHCTAKVIGFEQSILIPLGKKHVKSIVVGTVGSVDPYYHSTGQVTEKCDVYSYGVLLLELLTRRKTFEWSETGEDAGFVLVDFAISSVKGNQLHLIFEPCILKEKNMEQLMACAELAMKCIKWKPDERPTMKEAVQELRQIKDAL